MKYFTKIAEGLDVRPALEELVTSAKWYLADEGDSSATLKNGRMAFVDPAGTHFLRQERLLGQPWAAPSQFVGLPRVQALLEEVIERLGVRPEWASSCLRMLPPNSAMKPHRDSLPANLKRYQLPLQTATGAVFTIKNERCHLRRGELWLTNIGNRLHWVKNHSDIARVAMLVDVSVDARIGAVPHG